MKYTLRRGFYNLVFSNASTSCNYCQALLRSYVRVPPLLIMSMKFFSFSSSMDNGQVPFNSQGSADASANARFEDDQTRLNRMTPQNPPEPIPNRPLRGERNFDHRRRDDYGSRYSASQQSSRVGGGGNRTTLPSNDKFGAFVDRKSKISPNVSSQIFPSPHIADKEQSDDEFLKKFKLGNYSKGEKLSLPHEAEPQSQPQRQSEEMGQDNQSAPEAPPPEADEIFKKMKETGLIPNAVAMLDGLCKDGLVQEAMKLFGLMREKGTIPEVVIYTAVVEGFCKAQKYDDAIRIFRKMQDNGVSPNAFSYTVLIQGLCKGKRFKDAINFCSEMLGAGHSPNLVTFTGLVDGVCREASVEEAKTMIVTLRQKGLSLDEKAVREYLDKKGPFLPSVWEAILGKKSPQKFF